MSLKTDEISCHMFYTTVAKLGKQRAWLLAELRPGDIHSDDIKISHTLMNLKPITQHTNVNKNLGEIG